MTRPEELNTEPPVEGETHANDDARTLAIRGLILLGVVALFGDVALLMAEHPSPTGLVAVSGAVIGALATMLHRTDRL